LIDREKNTVNQEGSIDKKMSEEIVVEERKK